MKQCVKGAEHSARDLASPTKPVIDNSGLTDSCGVAIWLQAPGPSRQVGWLLSGSGPSSQDFLCSFSPGQRTDEELDLIFEELLHIKAVAHLSNSVSTHGLALC